MNDSYFRQGTEDVLFLPRSQEIRCQIPEREWRHLKKLLGAVREPSSLFSNAGFCLVGVSATSAIANLTITTLSNQARTACWAISASAVLLAMALFLFSWLRRRDQSNSIRSVAEYLEHIEEGWQQLDT